MGRAIAALGGEPEHTSPRQSRGCAAVHRIFRHPQRPAGRYLHHNFVVAVLNDLFGIQSRGGCSCAGPYGHRLLGIDIERSHAFEREIAHGCEGIKPGWVRVNFNYFISETVFEYVLRAVDMLAEPGVEAARPTTASRRRRGCGITRTGRPDPAMRLTDVSYAAGLPPGRTAFSRTGDDAPAYVPQAGQRGRCCRPGRRLQRRAPADLGPLLKHWRASPRSSPGEPARPSPHPCDASGALVRAMKTLPATTTSSASWSTHARTGWGERRRTPRLYVAPKPLDQKAMDHAPALGGTASGLGRCRRLEGVEIRQTPWTRR